jgi:hypothetical protein
MEAEKATCNPGLADSQEAAPTGTENMTNLDVVEFSVTVSTLRTSSRAGLEKYIHRTGRGAPGTRCANVAMCSRAPLTEEHLI